MQSGLGDRSMSTEERAPSKNIELKARLPDLVAARNTALRLATENLGVERQVDTYFFCRNGRLKLREIERGGTHAKSELVAYTRPDESHAKASRYHIVPVREPTLLKGALAASLGVRAVVDKVREIFLWYNVRIHLDRVRDLGTFLEFEAVLGTSVDEESGHAQVSELRSLFGIQLGDLVAVSYGDMIAEDAPST